MSRFSGPAPSNGLCNGFTPIKGGGAVLTVFPAGVQKRPSSTRMNWTLHGDRYKYVYPNHTLDTVCSSPPLQRWAETTTCTHPPPPFSFLSGLNQSECRDLKHAQYTRWVKCRSTKPKNGKKVSKERQRKFEQGKLEQNETNETGTYSMFWKTQSWQKTIPDSRSKTKKT